ncbi:glycosyltransferase [Butyrivibrio sp. NC3005]|uniref:glycosyltransferase n=1 Tax=Butyrivibrio sp. NC3005 TaxID=1280685 RepID=UPI0003F7E493|nr:glycosyltransferase [Butyrivibrio sp. NC3005]
MVPFFYIIVVCFNAGDKLIQTIESVKKQSFKSYEIIVKDGGSADDSIDRLCREYNVDKKSGLSKDGSIRLVTGKDSGIYDAMNVACDTILGTYSYNRKDKSSIGPFVYFLNCGDYFVDENVLQKVHDHINKAGSMIFLGENVDGGKETSVFHKNIFYGNIFERKTSQVVYSNPVINDFTCYRNVPCHQACFYDIELMLLEHFDTTWQVRADYEHFLRCFYFDNARMHFMPVTVADYEGGGFSETKENRKVSERERREIISRYMPKKKVILFDIFRIVTLAPLRTVIAGNPQTAKIYNGIKTGIYKCFVRK